MKEWLKTLREFGGGLALGMGIIFGASFGANQCLNNTEYICDYFHSKTLPDFPLGYTTFEKEKDGDCSIKKNYPTFLDGLIIYDNNKPDGLADEITFSEGDKWINISREKGYAKYKERFDNADKILKEETKRFAPYFEGD